MHIGVNKPKLMFVLRSSKTHTKGDQPQVVKIVGTHFSESDPICPFKALSKYIQLRRRYLNAQEQLFVFRDRTPVKPTQFRKVLRDLIIRNRLNPLRFGMHGMRAGHAGDLLELGISVEKIKKLGRWRSTAVYTYLRH